MAQKPAFLPDEVLVGVSGNTRSQRASRVAALEPLVGKAVGYSSSTGVARLKVRRGMSVQQAIRRLQQSGSVTYAEPNYLRYAFTDPNDSQYTTNQYAPQLTQANLAWDQWKPNGNIVLAIVDTGVDGTHPDLTNKMYRVNGAIHGYNALTSTPGDAADDFWHGTHCAGIAAAQINNTTGVAGIAGWNPAVPGSSTVGVQIMPVKVLDSTGSGPDSAVAAGITWAADNGANVISLSLGSSSSSQTLQNAVSYAWNKGCVIVAAAGNNGSNSFSYPAAFDHVISVAATDSNDTIASFSNWGSWVSMAAPGVGIRSTTPGNGYFDASGTSMACPHVSGAAALIWSGNPKATNADVRAALVGNTDPYNAGTRTPGSIAGRLNALRAENALGVAQILPGPASGLSATGSFSGITLSWGAALGGATQYNVKRSTVPGGPYTTISTGVAGTSYSDTTAPVGTPSYYVVSGVNVLGEGTQSAEAVGTRAAAAYTLTAAPTSVAPGANVTVSWTASTTPSSRDWVGLYQVGASNTSYSWWKYTGGTTSGNFSVPAPTAPGQYEFRYFLNDGWTVGATSNAFTVTSTTTPPSGGQYTLTATPQTANVGDTLTINWTAPAGASSKDFVALYQVGASNTSYSWWKYTGGTTSGSLTVPAPTAPGQYEFRYFLNDGWNQAATSNPVTVQTGVTPPSGGSYSVTASPTTVSAGQSVTVSWTAPAGASSRDFVALYQVGASNTSYIWWKYTGGTTSGSFTVTAPSAAGQYEFRYFLNDGWNMAASSNAFTVGGTTPPPTGGQYTLAASPTTVSAGQSVTVSWTAPAGASSRDFVALYQVGASNTSYSWWKYTGGTTSGSFTVPAPSAAGQYEFRYFLNDGWNLAATSNPFTVSSLTAIIGGDLGTRQVFPADNAWNTDISNAPVDPNSANLIASIGLTGSLHPDFGTYYSGAPWGIPYVTVSGTQATVPVSFDYAGESDPGPYPIPSNAPIEGGPNGDGDRHVLVVDRDHWKLYELMGAFPQPDGSWHASCGAIFDLASNALRPAGWTSADAAGLPIFPGLVRYEEAVALKAIRHALRFTCAQTRNAYVAPATHCASTLTDPNLPPMGMRVRLKASFDISGYPASAQVILRALKQYGMFLADNGANWFLSGAPDDRWNDAEIETLKQVHGSDFEVVQMGAVVTQ